MTERSRSNTVLSLQSIYDSLQTHSLFMDVQINKKAFTLQIRINGPKRGGELQSSKPLGTPDFSSVAKELRLTKETEELNGFW